MRKILAVAAVLALAACGTTPADIKAAGDTAQAYVAAAKPTINAVACAGQAGANTATDALLATHNAADAATSAQVSKVLGLACYTTAPAAS
jgi:uncharacterized lipoprotein